MENSDRAIKILSVFALTGVIDAVIGFSPIPSISETDPFNLVKTGSIGVTTLIGIGIAGYAGRTVEPVYAPQTPKPKRVRRSDETPDDDNRLG